MRDGEASALEPHDLAVRLRRLEEIERIQQLKYSYAEVVDATVADPDPARIARLAAMFAEDATVVYGPFAELSGRAAVAEFYRGASRDLIVWSSHLMLHPNITLDPSDPNRASGTWRLLAHLIYTADRAAGPQTVWGTYRDEYVKTDGGWVYGKLVIDLDVPPKF